MQNTLTLLTTILGSIQIIDIMISLGLYFIYQKNRDYLLVAGVWFGMCLMFLTESYLGDLAPSHIYFSYSFTGITGIFLGELVSKHYSVSYQRNNFIILLISCLLISGILNLIGVSNFTFLSFIVSVGVVSPVIYSIVLTFIHHFNKKGVALYTLDYFFLFVVIVWAIHLLDYSFLRPLSDMRFSIFGYSFALGITYLTSILLPVMVNRRIYLNFSENLEISLHDKNLQLIKAQSQIIAREKLASLGALTAGIAHEIKNPLNIIQNGALLINQFVSHDMKKYQEELVHKRLDFGKKLQSDIKRLEEIAGLIDRNAQRADNIVRNMLIQSRNGKAELKEMDINKVVLESISFVKESTKAKFPFDPEIRPELTPIGYSKIYYDDLTRALINIIENALYALYSKHRYEIYAAKLIVRTYLEQDFIVIEVEDNGPGISKEIITEVLNPFFTTKPTGEGTGLGLSMAFDVMKMHNGSIEIESNTDTKSFTLFILRIAKDLE